MFYRIGLGLLLSGLFSITALAQNATITGTVVQLGEPLGFATVILGQNGAVVTGTQTTEDGAFRFSGLDAGTYSIIIQFPGANDTLNGIDVAGNQTIPLGKIDVEAGFELIVTDKLVNADETVMGQTFDADVIRTNAARDVTSIAVTTAGVASNDNNSGFSIRGGRESNGSTQIFVDGVRVIGSSTVSQAAIGNVEVITGGTPPWYGDLTSGAINISTRSAPAEHSIGAEFVTSRFTDPYNYNLVALNLTGPLLKAIDSTGEVPFEYSKLSYLVAAEYQYVEDADPPAEGIVALSDGDLENLRNNPAAIAPGTEQNFTGPNFVSAANFVNDDQITTRDLKRNNVTEAIRANMRLDYKLNQNTTLRFGGFYNRTLDDQWSFNRALFAPDANEQFEDNLDRGYLRFQQTFNVRDENNRNSLIKDIFYNVQVEYTMRQNESKNAEFGDDFFRYGHVGTFNNQSAQTYNIVSPGDAGYNPEIGQSYYQTSGVIDTAFYFDGSNSSNPIMANYNQFIYDYFADNPRDLRGLVNTAFIPPFQFFQPIETYTIVNANDLLNRGGILNGFTTPFNNTAAMNVYSLWEAPGNNSQRYVKRQDELYRATGQANITLGPEDFEHNIKIGFEADQRFERVYFVNAPSLWIRGRQLLNNHLSEFSDDPADITYVPFGGTFLAQSPAVYNAANQSTFDLRLRQSLGLAPDNTTFLNIDALGPDQLDIEMFSADELIQLGNNNGTIDYYGYSYTGDLAGDTEDGAFFTDVENRPRDAYAPTYLAGYIHDKFQLDRIFLSLGVRVDRFDANQLVLKDPYVLAPTFSAGETAQLLGEELPGIVGDDWIAYVDDALDPNEIVGYRFEDTWYDVNGTETSPQAIARLSNGETRPHLRQDSLSLDAMSDYEPVVNVMPRLSFSFPINDRANFFAHYDVLTQRPRSANILNIRDYVALEQVVGEVTNANLQPERTIDYEVGLSQTLDPDGNIALTISAYYREFRDMVQVVRVANAYPKTYDTFENLDFSTVKGFTFDLTTRRLGIFRMNTAYTLQFAEGTGSSFTSSRTALNGVEGFTVLRTLLPLSFDQRHTIAGNIDIRWIDRPGAPGKKGPRIGNIYPLRNFGASLTFNLASGRPYTRNSLPNLAEVQFGVNSTSQVDGTAFGSRLPFNFRADLRLDKDFYLKFGGRNEEGTLENTRESKSLYFNVYAAILNVLDIRNVVGVYANTGEPDNSGILESAVGQQTVQNVALDQDAFVDQFRAKEQNPNNFSLPRQIRLGITLNF